MSAPHWFDLSAIPETGRKRATGLTVTVRGIEWYEPAPVTRKRNGQVTVISYGKDGSRNVKVRSGNTPYSARAARMAERAAELAVKEVYVTPEATVTAPTLYDGVSERSNVTVEGSAKLLSPSKRRDIMRARRGY